MADYDNKLGEWFKQVEKMAQQVKSKKSPADSEPEEKENTALRRAAPETTVSDRQAPASAVATMDSAVATSESVLDEESETETPRPVTTMSGSNHVLFDEADVPPDFFSFLSRSEEPNTAKAEDVVQDSSDQRLLNLSEGTGEPRPIIVRPQPRTLPKDKIETSHEAQVRPAPEPTPKPAPAPATPSGTEEGWERMPHHLQILFSAADEEVAQNSYKTFKENRGELIQRLLDPSVTLEEAARILNVCPTTVRRYTNRGVLKHFRTAGNQRRFRLSDVLGFMENSGRGPAETAASDAGAGPADIRA